MVLSGALVCKLAALAFNPATAPVALPALIAGAAIYGIVEECKK